MIWDLFKGRGKEGKRGDADEFDPIIDRIERFAPRKYRSERGQFYYNYKMLALYRKPLIHLLEGVARGGGADPEHLAAELFQSLKEFYDPKARLSLTAAKEDGELMRRYGELFVIFYGMERPTRDEMRRWLRNTQ